MKEPKFPKKKNKLYGKNIDLAKKMLLNNSERYVANYFGISRCCLRYNSFTKIKKDYIRRSVEWRKNNPEKFKEYSLSSSKKRYHLKNKMYPEEMKKARKINRLKMGKEYFRKYMKEYRELIKNN